jgi:hypothetical protein
MWTLQSTGSTQQSHGRKAGLVLQPIFIVFEQDISSVDDLDEDKGCRTEASADGKVRPLTIHWRRTYLRQRPTAGQMRIYSA